MIGGASIFGGVGGYAGTILSVLNSMLTFLNVGQAIQQVVYGVLVLALKNMTVLMQPLSEPVVIRPFKTEADYEAALAELECMIGRMEPGTPDGNRYEMLAALVEAYEEANYPIEASDDPVAMIEFVLQARGLTRKDLEPYIGTRQRVWDIMEKRRRLTLPMIRRLSKGLNIPIDVLAQEYDLDLACHHRDHAA